MLRLLKISDLNKELKKYIFEQTSIDLINKAYRFAKKQHANQFRKSTRPFIQHPLYTGYYLAKWRMEPTMICAGLLHDILEDTPITFKKLSTVFNPEIANLVKSVTKISYFAKKQRANLQTSYLAKLYCNLAKDIRVIIIKIADRLHNIKTIQYHTIKKQIEICQETLNIYASIAHRIGMTKAQFELEDLSFKVLDFKNYQLIKSKIKLDNNKSKKYLENIITIIKNNYPKLIKTEVSFETRVKSIYSIYRKMQQKNKLLSEIHDVLAIRIIVNSVLECYQMLGVVHNLFTPLKNTFKDYIAAPKWNLYKSLHTILLDKTGKVFEIQIRTVKMNQTATYGVASHWQYKYQKKYVVKKQQEKIDDQINLFKGILKIYHEFKNNKELKQLNFPKQIKEDIFSSLIYVLTPKGKVITLKNGATALDFAYKVHTEIGNRISGAYINNKFKKFSTVLNSGDVIKIIVNKKQHPKQEWLKIAKTHLAKLQIKKYLRKYNHE